MNSNLVFMVREMNHLLAESDKGYVSFGDLCKVTGDMLNSNVYVMSKKGKVLASFTMGDVSKDIIEEKNGESVFMGVYNDRVLDLSDIEKNISAEELVRLFGDGFSDYEKNMMIIPVTNGGKRIGTMIFSREEPFDDENEAICEYAAAIVGIEVSREDAIEEKNDIRLRNAVIMALDSLSYSELNAVMSVFGEFDGDEILMVTGRVAEKFDITKSVIVNALKKLESAGVIETRSLGMKGTRMKIINPYLREELDGISL